MNKSLFVVLGLGIVLGYSIRLACESHETEVIRYSIPERERKTDRTVMGVVEPDNDRDVERIEADPVHEIIVDLSDPESFVYMDKELWQRSNGFFDWSSDVDPFSLMDLIIETAQKYNLPKTGGNYMVQDPFKCEYRVPIDERSDQYYIEIEKVSDCINSSDYKVVLRLPDKHCLEKDKDRIGMKLVACYCDVFDQDEYIHKYDLDLYIMAYKHPGWPSRKSLVFKFDSRGIVWEVATGIDMLGSDLESDDSTFDQRDRIKEKYSKYEIRSKVKQFCEFFVY